jgi:hypothetical protein
MEGDVLIDTESCTDDITSTIYRSTSQRNLQQRRQLLLILNRRSRMYLKTKSTPIGNLTMIHGSYESTLVTEGTVTSHTNISSNSLSKHFHTKNIPNNLLRLPLNVGMYEGYIVIARDDIA